jgi:hypothetical protein
MSLQIFLCVVLEKSPVSFVFKLNKMDKVDEPVVDKTKMIKLEFLMGPDKPNSASKYFRQLNFFKYGFPENLIKWLISFRDVENLMILKEPADKTRMFWTLLKGQTLSYFEHHLRRSLDPVSKYSRQFAIFKD